MRARRAGADLSDPLLEGLSRYLDLLIRWNRTINLTGLSSLDEAVDRLLVEPVIAARELPAGAIRILDVGSGAGSPGFPLKLAQPAAHLTLVESKVRKAAFLREVVRELRLTEVDVETARYEQLLSRADLTESADVVSVRAVRADARLLRGIQGFVRPSGRLWLFKTGDGDAGSSVHLPFEVERSVKLVESLRSSLVIVRRLPVPS